MTKFVGASIALLEARMSNEMADMVRRYGGEPYCVPAVREFPLDKGREQVSTFINHLAQSSIRTFVLYTGAGATVLFQEAERIGRLPELLSRLHAVTVVCRGPKPSAVLKRYGVPITLSAREPYTTKELLEAMMPLELRDTDVAVLHYGERNIELVQALQERGANLEELCLYEWLLPEDTTPLQTLVQNIIAARVDAVVFTSQIQVRHLFLVATELALSAELTHALNTKTIVASIGPTCTTAVQSAGVTPHVIPEHPKMGYLLKALVEYMA